MTMEQLFSDVTALNENKSMDSYISIHLRQALVLYAVLRMLLFIY